MKPRSIVLGISWLVVILALVAGWAALVDSGRLTEISGGQPIFLTFAGLSAPLLGTIVLRRHPTEWTGPLLCISVITAILAACRTSPLSVMSEVTGVIALVTVLLPAVVVVRHPALQATRRVAAATMWCWWLSAAGGVLIAGLVIVGGSVPRAWWYADDPGSVGVVVIGLLAGYSLLILTGVATAAIFVIARYRSMPRGGRAALRPVVLPLVAWAVATAAAIGWSFITGISSPTINLDSRANTVFVILPAVLVYVLAVGVAWVDVMVRRPAPSVFVAGREPGVRRSGETYVEQYLARALADPSIRVRYPVLPATEGWVEEWMDGNGEVVGSDLRDPDRGMTLIRRGSTIIGLVEQDAATAARPDAVELVATGAGLIMETERLMAAARLDLEQSRLLAGRLLSATDAPRAELRAELLAGPLDELRCAAADLAAGRDIGEIAPRLTAVSAEVRTISHGVFPPALTSGGLDAALPGRVASAGRYPAAVELTAYLAARLDPTAAIEATPADQPGLRISTGLAPEPTVRDRVSALGGSVAQAGTRWLITVPATG